MEIAPADVERLVAALVAIDSVNPTLVPGGAGEAEVVRFAAEWMEAGGLEVEVVEAAPGRPSVLGIARGRGGGRSLMLCGHLDTVGVEGMSEPHAPRVSDGRLYGRGGYDMKGGVAACMLAAAAAAREPLAGDVIVAAVADEEHSSIGVQAVLERVHAGAAPPAACVVTEPTSLDVVVAHKGFAWWEVTATGRAAHGSQPQLGVDAIAAMGPVLTAVAELERSLGERTVGEHTVGGRTLGARTRAERGHALLGRGSVHASLIEGGQELSSYPERCVLAIERRTIPGEYAAQLDGELGRLLGVPTAAELTGRTMLVREPFEVAPDEPIVRLVREHAAARLGREPAVRGHSAWMDAAFTSAAGIPTVVFGPHGAGAHAVEEWVDLASVRDCAEVLRATARAFCGVV
jgi:acetylornithine deacetylase